MAGEVRSHGQCQTPPNHGAALVASDVRASLLLQHSWCPSLPCPLLQVMPQDPSLVRLGLQTPTAPFAPTFSFVSHPAPALRAVWKRRCRPGSATTPDGDQSVHHPRARSPISAPQPQPGFMQDEGMRCHQLWDCGTAWKAPVALPAPMAHVPPGRLRGWGLSGAPRHGPSKTELQDKEEGVTPQLNPHHPCSISPSPRSPPTHPSS